MLRGGKLKKFRKVGRGSAASKKMKVVSTFSGASQLAWDTRKEEIIRADSEVQAACFQGESPPSDPGSFQVVLAARMLFLVAENAEAREAWVAGINALATGGASRLQTDEVALASSGEDRPAKDGSQWVVVQDAYSGSVFMRDFGPTASGRSGGPLVS